MKIGQINGPVECHILIDILVVTGMGQCVCYTPMELASQLAFVHNRALAGGVTFLGYSAGAAVSSPVVAYLLEEYGWRGTLLLLAGIVLHRVPIAMTIQIASLEKSEFKQSFIKELIDLRLYKHKTFALFCIACIFHRSSITAFNDHIPSRVVQLGATIQEASRLPVVIFTTVTVTRIMVSIVANLLSTQHRPVFFILGSVMGTLGSVTIVVIEGFVGGIVGSAFLGLNIGMYYTQYTHKHTNTYICIPYIWTNIQNLATNNTSEDVKYALYIFIICTFTLFLLIYFTYCKRQATCLFVKKKLLSISILSYNTGNTNTCTLFENLFCFFLTIISLTFNFLF